MRIDILTIFPDMFVGPFGDSIIKRALQRELLEIHTVNIRDFSSDKHRTVDDYPFGGGAGMLMKPEPIIRSLEHIQASSSVPERPYVVYMSPQGNRFSQEKAQHLASKPHLVLLCGHYEGIDQRVIDALVDEEISIGDYILTGGELAAMVVADAVARLLPGVLGHEESAVIESFTDGLLEYPQYTRPREYQGLAVPDVLLSGNHEQIRLWRREQSLQRTLQRRPDLLNEAGLTPEDRKLLKRIKAKHHSDNHSP